MAAGNAAIFDAQARSCLIGFTRSALQVIQSEHIDAAAALAETGERYATMLETIEDPLIAGRAADMRDAVEHWALNGPTRLRTGFEQLESQ